MDWRPGTAAVPGGIARNFGRAAQSVPLDSLLESGLGRGLDEGMSCERLSWWSMRWGGVASCVGMVGWIWAASSVGWAAGAGDGAGGRGKEGGSWWSLRPLVRPAVPGVGTGPGGGGEHPVDAFVRARLASSGLQASPEADRRTLIRRLSFDLVGLPPTPEEVEAFERDADPRAYERLVDRLLASPRHGERWARHWLDVVHFGETHGYDKDKPRPNAWPYRDYVIRSLNEDKPYERFVQEQVAGDVLFPGTRDGIEALGFVSAGPWDFIGHEEVPESKIDGKVARHLDRDDMVANTIQTFASLTVQCAQCHDHKFDPISQEDYYSLQAVFAAVDRADRRYDADPAVARTRAEWTTRQETMTARREALDRAVLARAGDVVKELDRRIAEGVKAMKGSEAFGYHSGIESRPDVAKWVQVDLGRSEEVERVVLHPCKDDFAGIGEGFGFPPRYRVEASDDPDFGTGVTVVADHAAADVPNPGLRAREHGAKGLRARHVRVTATRLATRSSDYIFALAELQVLGPGGTNWARGKGVRSLDSIEGPPRWARANLTDGWSPGAGRMDGGAVDVAGLRREREREVEKATLAAEREERATLEAGLAEAKAALAALPPAQVAYVATVHRGGGAFAGTGANGGKPRAIHVLSRGNVQKPGRGVGPGTLSCVAGLPSRFDLPEGHGEGERRAALARWLTRRDNPVPWRSIVNRVWQYHFGKGLVETPNDFGRMGGLPSHPELLEWLAVEFRDGGQSLKALHRWIVTSATYRQRSDVAQERASAMDADNRLLWRAGRRKLEAEAVRDATLMVAGQLDLRMGGPSFQDFVVERPEHSPHYEYHLHDPEDPRSHRRSVYRFVVRSQQQPFMTVLDCADPSMQVGRRNEGASPLQALALLNNPLMLSMSRHFASRLEAMPGDLDARVARAHAEALGRAPTTGERAALEAHARAHGLANTCRLLLNLNEFVYID